MINSNRSIIIGIIFGTILEWYDFSLLGSLAPIISKLFFPSVSPTLSLLATFGVFATGFIARPIGGLIFGHIGDRYGRKNALSQTIILMAIPTTLIGLLPTYQNAGIIASLLLIGLRLMQGFSSSGEYPGAICVLTETAHECNRGFIGSLSMLGTVGGVFLGSIINLILTSYLTNEQIYSWGWRLPFILGMPLGLIGWYLRKHLQESLVSIQNFNKKIEIPVITLLRTNFFNLKKIILLFSLSTISFYMGFVYIVGYLINNNAITFHEGLIDTAIGTLTLALLIPLFGFLSDRFGRNIFIVCGIIGLLIFFYPIFQLFSLGTSQGLLAGQICLVLLIAIFVGPLAAITSEIFPSSIRYTGISAGINIGATIFGGMCPFVAALLVQQTGNSNMPSVYPILFAAICLGLMFKSMIRN